MNDGLPNLLEVLTNGKEDEFTLTTKLHQGQLTGILSIDLRGNNAIHVIASRAKQFVNLVPTLLDIGIPVNATNYKKQTALHLFCLYSVSLLSVSILEAFQKHQGDATICDDSLSTPLHYLCKIDLKKVTPPDEQLLTQVTGALVAMGGRFDVFDKFGKSPLHYLKKAELLKIFSHFGADVNMADKDGFTLLHRACEREDKGYAQILLEDHGVDVNMGTLKEHNTCLHLAVLQNKKRIMTDFLFDTNISLNIENTDGLTPSSLATHLDRMDHIQLLENHRKVIEAMGENQKRVLEGKLFFFDLEGDSMFAEYDTQEEGLREMKMSLGIGFDGAQYYTFFGENSEDIELLGKKFDEAEEIIIFNYNSDLSILEKYYVFGDEDTHGKQRIKLWKEKTLDPFKIITELEGSWVSLDILAKANKLGGKLVITDTPAQLWREGRIEELKKYCKQDVDLMVQMYIKGSYLKFPITKEKGPVKSPTIGGKVVDLHKRKIVSWTKS